MHRSAVVFIVAFFVVSFSHGLVVWELTNVRSCRLSGIAGYDYNQYFVKSIIGLFISTQFISKVTHL